MELQDFLAHVDSGAAVEGGTEQHRFMHDAAQEAFRITAAINNGYRPPDEVRALLAQLTGRPIDDSVVVFPPFHSEFGKNLTLGRGVFITSAAASRTPAASPSATVPSSDTAAR
jgi:acetyltransferase-like isoleucine patch superfamily enzyme